MKQAKDFWKECQDLIVEYGQTSQGDTLRGIREDLRRWVATESQTDWQNDYNTTKARIKRDCLDKGDFSNAVREWKRFGETSSDPLLKSRIDSELLSINNDAVKAAEELIASGAGRAQLEEAVQRFNGTDGQKTLTSKLRSMK